MRGEKGFALILTLIVTALMVAALVELIHQAYVDISLSRGFRDGQQASLLAESGALGGAKLIQFTLQGQNYTSLNDAWATPVKLDDEIGTLEISVTEESGRININNFLYNTLDGTETFTLKALKRLGKQLQVPEEVWSSLADWQDSDDQTRSNGAETPYYQAQKPPYKAGNGKLATLAEQSLVKGFTPEIFAKLKPFVTIYSDGAPQSLVNINTASKEVLMALNDGIDERLAERILEGRRLKPFTVSYNVSNIVGGETISPQLTGNISYKGNLFRITSIARVKETARTVEAVVRITDGKTLSWQEY